MARLLPDAVTPLHIFEERYREIRASSYTGQGSSSEHDTPATARSSTAQENGTFTGSCAAAQNTTPTKTL